MSNEAYGINECSHGGWLVGLNHDADVADVTEYQWETRDPVVPCSRLFCARCRTWVAEDMDARQRALEPQTQEDRESAVRVYRCTCSVAAIPFAVSTERLREEGEALCLPRVDWFCAGHVAAHLPVRVGDHVVSDERSALDTLEKLLQCGTDGGGQAPISQIYFRLAGSPIQTAILHRLRDAICDAGLQVRSAALAFWRREPGVDDAGALYRAICESPELFDAVDDPNGDGTTLHDNLMRALARRVQRGSAPDEGLRDRLRAYALGSSGAEHIFPALVAHDLSWVLLNAPALAASGPRASAKLRMCLRRQGVAVERLPSMEISRDRGDVN